MQKQNVSKAKEIVPSAAQSTALEKHVGPIEFMRMWAFIRFHKHVLWAEMAILSQSIAFP